VASDVYATGTTIVNAALESLPIASDGSWPSTAVRIAWVNDGMLEAQRLTMHYRECESQTITDGNTYYEFTLQDPSLFTLVEVWVGSNQQKIVSYDHIRRSRADSETIADDTYLFASNRVANTTFGSVRLEMYPAANADDTHPTGADDVTVEVRYASAPPRLTALSETAYMPRDILGMYVAWRAALARRPEKAHVFRKTFEGLCMEARIASGLSDMMEKDAIVGFI
jgi:hypothetical protein